ncbi:hypothetical protein K9K77_01495 [Candidatus Babeliales bacterium]|nr:hypothetical protein [Candidatus Babeliales bacterium]
MIKKLAIIRKEKGHLLSRDSTSLETHLISKLLTDTCKNEPRTQDWIYDSYYEVYEENCSLLTKENDFMIFQSLYNEENPPHTFKCSRKAFITLIDQWNSARKENKEFIIIELDESNIIHLYASDKVPAEYLFKLPPILESR